MAKSKQRQKNRGNRERRDTISGRSNEVDARHNENNDDEDIRRDSVIQLPEDAQRGGTQFGSPWHWLTLRLPGRPKMPGLPNFPNLPTLPNLRRLPGRPKLPGLPKLWSKPTRRVLKPPPRWPVQQLPVPPHSRLRIPGSSPLRNYCALVFVSIKLLIVFGALYVLVQYLLLAIRVNAACTPTTIFYPVTLTITSFMQDPSVCSQATVPIGGCSSSMPDLTTTVTSFVPTTTTITVAESTVTFFDPAAITTVTITESAALQPSPVMSSFNTPTYSFWVTSGSTVWQDGISPTGSESFTYVTTSYLVSPAAAAPSATLGSMSTTSDTAAPVYEPTTFSLATLDTTITVTSTHYTTVSVSELQTRVHSSFTGVAASGWNASTHTTMSASPSNLGSSSDPVTTTTYVTSTSTTTIYSTITPVFTTSSIAPVGNITVHFMTASSTALAGSTGNFTSFRNSSSMANATRSVYPTNASSGLARQPHGNTTTSFGFPASHSPTVKSHASWGLTSPATSLLHNVSATRIPPYPSTKSTNYASQPTGYAWNFTSITATSVLVAVPPTSIHLPENLTITSTGPLVTNMPQPIPPTLSSSEASKNMTVTAAAATSASSQSGIVSALPSGTGTTSSPSVMGNPPSYSVHWYNSSTSSASTLKSTFVISRLPISIG